MPPSRTFHPPKNSFKDRQVNPSQLPSPPQESISSHSSKMKHAGTPRSGSSVSSLSRVDGTCLPVYTGTEALPGLTTVASVNHTPLSPEIKCADLVPEPTLPSESLLGPLPPRDKHPDTRMFIFLWMHYDDAKRCCKQTFREIREIVDEQLAREGKLPRRRPARSEQEIVNSLWVEGPRATGAICEYFKAKAKLKKVTKWLLLMDEKYSSPVPPATPSISNNEDTTPDPPTPPKPATELPSLPKPLPRSSKPNTASTTPPLRSSNRLRARAGVANGEQKHVALPRIAGRKRKADEEVDVSTVQRRSVKKRSRLTILSDNESESESEDEHPHGRKASKSPAFKGKENERATSPL
ncbi:hypothetical protein FRB99_006835 [Tulasnella sp. 403]|nr:hypothetical protein FRB99_006835 [Tulasnella sp. 403]